MGENSFRNFDIERQFSNDFKKCDKKPIDERSRCESNIRGRYRAVESGRLGIMADKIHSFISHLDGDEIKSFKNKFPRMTNVANDFAVVEELREF